MKIRAGFVSNSSSSSFICDVCGRVESGWDLPMADAMMFECTNGHTFCENESVEEFSLEKYSRDDKIETLIEYHSYWKDNPHSSYYMLKSGEFSDFDLEGLWGDYCSEMESELRYNMPEKHCPICQMLEILPGDVADYLVIKTGVGRDEILSDIKRENSKRDCVYDGECIVYLLREENLRLPEVIDEIRDRFETYREFKEFINEN